MTIAGLAGVLVLAAAPAPSGCASDTPPPAAPTAPTGPAAPPPQRATRAHAMVFIKTGPLRSPTREQSAEAMEGHMANIHRLAGAGALLIAGPLAEPGGDPDDRGIFVFGARTPGGGAALAATDPAARMGVFVMDPFLLTTDAPLAELPGLERAFERRRLEDPGTPHAWFGRMYVLASAPRSDGPLARVRGAPGVLIAGRLTGGPARAPGPGRVLPWLDAPNARLAAPMLPEADRAWQGWFASPTPEQLPALLPGR